MYTTSFKCANISTVMQVLDCCHEVYFVSLGFACAGHYSLMHEALQKVSEQINPALILCALLTPNFLLFVIQICFQ